MIERIQSYLHPKTVYNNPLTQQRANGLVLFLGGGFLVTLLSSIYIISNLVSQSTDGTFSLTIGEIIGVVSPIFILVFYGGVRNGYYRISAIAIVTFMVLPLLNYWNTSLNTIEVLAFTLPIITAGALLGRRISLLLFVITIFLAAGPTLINNSAVADFITFVSIFSIIGILVLILSSNMQRIALRFSQELYELQNVIQTILNTSSESDETTAIITTINIVRDQLGYTFARVYLVEEDEVVQRIQTGLNLSQMNIDTNISIAKASGIYSAIRSKDIVVLKEGDDDIIRQHLLGGTRGALAVPILGSNETVIAVVDIQSEDLDDFSSTEIQTVKLVVRQLGQTIERLRLITNLREDLSEQDKLIARQRQRLIQYEQTERQATTDTWARYLQEKGTDFMGYDMEEGATSPIEAIDLKDDLQSAIQTGSISIEHEGNQQIVRVPIILRGQTLGAMSFRVPAGNQAIGARQQELIHNVVQRLSLALENKRLFEQSQSQATRERKANEVGNLLLSSTDIDTVLNLAASNFNEALGAIQTQIRLKPEIRNLGESEVKP